MRTSKIVVFLFLLSFLSLIRVESSLCWKNKKAHPAMNTHAIQKFEQLSKLDPRMAKISLNGAECRGVAWDYPQDGTSLKQQNTAVTRSKSLKRWIIDGGFSADEPEIPMALRHFYDPLGWDKGKTWLTDEHGVVKLLEKHLIPERGVPEIDAVTWAMDKDDTGDDGASGDHGTELTQDYSWYDAKKYLTLALADESRDNLNYGKAWRAVGEVMHLMSDMAMPAHVRNDGHMFFEPLEKVTDEATVEFYSAYAPCSTLPYSAEVETLMKALATWTNENFLSQDTIPIPGQKITANGKKVYPSPLPSKTTGGYEYYKVDGQSLLLARYRKPGIIDKLWGPSQLYNQNSLLGGK